MYACSSGLLKAYVQNVMGTYCIIIEWCLVKGIDFFLFQTVLSLLPCHSYQLWTAFWPTFGKNNACWPTFCMYSALSWINKSRITRVLLFIHPPGLEPGIHFLVYGVRQEETYQPPYSAVQWWGLKLVPCSQDAKLWLGADCTTHFCSYYKYNK